ncbi:MAG: Uma2 family endonuclease [Anaerolineae bacterium]
METAVAETAEVELYFATEEEFEAWCDEDVKAEYVDGKVIVHSPASTRHVDMVLFLASLLKFFVAKHDLGTVLGPEAQVRLRPGLRRVPDLLFVAKERTDIIRETFLEGPPDLIIEIVSPDSIARDWREKYWEYEQAGVSEYWVIDPQARRMDVYCLEETGRYKAMTAEAGVYRSRVVSGFWLRSGWLWQEPLPNVLEVVGELGVI